MTLTLEPRLPKGCEADRFPSWHPEPCLEGPCSAPAPDVGPGNSQDK